MDVPRNAPERLSVPASLESRRRAVVEALRALNRENPKPKRRPVDSPTAQAEQAPMTTATDLRAVEARLDALSGQVAEVITRLSSVETAVLESVWEQPHAATSPETVTATEPTVDEAYVDEAHVDEPSEEDERVSVPAVPLGEVRMSSEASRALFGG
jgi:hypothetical protein